MKNKVIFTIASLLIITTSRIYAGCCVYVTGSTPYFVTKCATNVESEEACIKKAERNKGKKLNFSPDKTLVCRDNSPSQTNPGGGGEGDVPGKICLPPEPKGCCYVEAIKNCFNNSTKKECEDEFSGQFSAGKTCDQKHGICVGCKTKKRRAKICLPGEECDVCDDPGLVKLNNFTAIPAKKGISLNWTTKTEPDSQGFKMWRAIPNLNHYCGCSGNIDDYTQIQVLDKEGKPVLIPAKGTETSGYDYSYLDEGAKPGIAYCYALEDIDSKGESKFYFEYVAFTQDNLEETQDNLEEIK
jgi:hypothetical protein